MLWVREGTTNNYIRSTGINEDYTRQTRTYDHLTVLMMHIVRPTE